MYTQQGTQVENTKLPHGPSHDLPCQHTQQIYNSRPYQRTEPVLDRGYCILCIVPSCSRQIGIIQALNAGTHSLVATSAEAIESLESREVRLPKYQHHEPSGDKLPFAPPACGLAANVRTTGKYNRGVKAEEDTDVENRSRIKTPGSMRVSLPRQQLSRDQYISTKYQNEPPTECQTNSNTSEAFLALDDIAPVNLSRNPCLL